MKILTIARLILISFFLGGCQFVSETNSSEEDLEQALPDTIQIESLNLNSQAVLRLSQIEDKKEIAQYMIEVDSFDDSFDCSCFFSKEIFADSIGETSYLKDAVLHAAWIESHEDRANKILIQSVITIPDTDWSYKFLIGVQDCQIEILSMQPGW